MKSFNEIYEELYKENNDGLEKLRKKSRTESVVSVIAIIIAVFIFIKLSSSTIWLAMILTCSICIIAAVKMFNNSKKFRTSFKENIIKSFIKNIDEGLNFYPEKGISSGLYRAGEFESYDRFYSEDEIEGMLDGKYAVRMSEVHTLDESTDSEGHTTTTTVFHGLFGVIDCSKSIHTNLKVRNNKGMLGKLFTGKTKIEMDSEEFEKFFDIYAENKIIAMQILTSDVMALMIDFREQYKIKYELTINDNKIYIRFHTGDVFEPKAFKSALDYDMLKKYYDIIEFVFSVSREINKAIDKTEI